MPTQEDLLSYFQPDYETGTLLRIKASGTQGKVGDVVRGYRRPCGYSWVKHKGKSYPLHRMLYVMKHGDITQDDIIDHINRDPTDNRIENLRKATISQNTINSDIRPNKTGQRNIDQVSWQYGGYSYEYYRVVVVVNGKKKQKRFNRSMPDALEQAIAYRNKLVLDNYGEFANI